MAPQPHGPDLHPRSRQRVRMCCHDFLWDYAFGCVWFLVCFVDAVSPSPPGAGPKVGRLPQPVSGGLCMCVLQAGRCHVCARRMSLLEATGLRLLLGRGLQPPLGPWGLTFHPKRKRIEAGRGPGFLEKQAGLGAVLGAFTGWPRAQRPGGKPRCAARARELVFQRLLWCTCAK